MFGAMMFLINLFDEEPDTTYNKVYRNQNSMVT